MPGMRRKRRTDRGDRAVHEVGDAASVDVQIDEAGRDESSPRSDER